MAKKRMRDDQETMPGKNGGVLKKGGTVGPGRPRKMCAQIVKELRTEHGVDLVTSQDVNDVYRLLLNLDLKTLSQYATDEGAAILVRAVARSLAVQKDFEVVEKIINRVFGLAVNRLALAAFNGEGDTASGEVVTEVKFTVVGGKKPPVTSEDDVIEE